MQETSYDIIYTDIAFVFHSESTIYITYRNYELNKLIKSLKCIHVNESIKTLYVDFNSCLCKQLYQNNKNYL